MQHRGDIEVLGCRSRPTEFTSQFKHSQRRHKSVPIRTNQPELRTKQTQTVAKATQMEPRANFQKENGRVKSHSCKQQAGIRQASGQSGAKQLQQCQSNNIVLAGHDTNSLEPQPLNMISHTQKRCWLELL